MESLDSFFSWSDYFEPRLHALSLFFSNSGRCSRFSRICIDQNPNITAVRPHADFSSCTVLVLQSWFREGDDGDDNNVFLALGQVPALANSFATTFQKKFACVRNLTMKHNE